MKISGKQKYLFLILVLLIVLVQFIRPGNAVDKLIKLPDSQVAMVKSSESKAEYIKYDEIKVLVREAIDLAGGFDGLIKNNDVVVLKPNLVIDHAYDRNSTPLGEEVNGVTTDWRVTRAVAEIVREYNPEGKVLIMEGSAGPTKEIMKNLNYTKEYIPMVDDFIALEDESGGWHEYNSEKLVNVKLEEGLLHKEYYLNKIYKEADVLISLPTLKNHWHAVVTGGVKNVGIGGTPASIYGISNRNSGRNNMVNHNNDDLHKWIHDFYKCRPVEFVVMDGLQGIQNGPTPNTSNVASKQMNMRLILAGKDAIAVDTIEALLTGWDPLSVNYLQYLNQSQLGNIDTSKINVIGEDVADNRKEFAGELPPAGGAKFGDDRGPEVKTLDSRVTGNNLELAITGDEISKIEIHTKDTLQKKVVSNFDDIMIDIGHLTRGKHQFKIKAYDRFLNYTIKEIEIDKKNNITYQAERFEKPAIIDGKASEKGWSTAKWAFIDNLWLGQPVDKEDFSGRYKLGWTPERLYLLAEITDDKLSDTHEDSMKDYYKDDTLEVFIDEDHSGGEHHSNSFNAFAYHIALDYRVIDQNEKGSIDLTDHIDVKRSRKGNKYIWEAAIKIYDDSYKQGSENQTVVLTPDKKMGVALAYCDNDGGNDRESFIGSTFISGSDKNIAWLNADVFGELILAE